MIHPLNDTSASSATPVHPRTSTLLLCLALALPLAVGSCNITHYRGAGVETVVPVESIGYQVSAQSAPALEVENKGDSTLSVTVYAERGGAAVLSLQVPPGQSRSVEVGLDSFYVELGAGPAETYAHLTARIQLEEGEVQPPPTISHVPDEAG